MLEDFDGETNYRFMVTKHVLFGSLVYVIDLHMYSLIVSFLYASLLVPLHICIIGVANVYCLAFSHMYRFSNRHAIILYISFCFL
jgi:hypothetical protein